MYSFNTTLKSKVLSLPVAVQPGYAMSTEQTKKPNYKKPCQQRGKGQTSTQIQPSNTQTERSSDPALVHETPSVWESLVQYSSTCLTTTSAVTNEKSLYVQLFLATLCTMQWGFSKTIWQNSPWGHWRRIHYENHDKKQQTVCRWTYSAGSQHRAGRILCRDEQVKQSVIGKTMKWFMFTV